MAKLHRIKDIAKKKGIKLVQLCEAVGITEQGLSRIMRMNITTTDNLERIASVLGINPCELLDSETSVSVAHNTGDVVGDGNTVASINADAAKAIDVLDRQLAAKDEQITRKDEQIARKDDDLRDRSRQIDRLLGIIEAKT